MPAFRRGDGATSVLTGRDQMSGFILSGRDDDQILKHRPRVAVGQPAMLHGQRARCNPSVCCAASPGV